MNRIALLMMAGLSLISTNIRAQAPAKPIDIVVYRSPTCSCCGRWVEHMRNNNFNVKDNVTDTVQSIKDKYGVTAELASCHTAVVDGYVVEGHVPAEDIMTLLQKRPKVVGLAVPGMPVGTPGMEMGDKKDDYDVVSFDSNKRTAIFKSYHPGE